MESGTCENAPRPGAPKLLTNGDIRQIKRHICHYWEAHRQPLGDIIVDLNLPVSEWTLESTIINNIGLGYRIEQKTPQLSLKQKAVQLAFAKEYLNWGFKEWIHVWWSDEMSMQTGANHCHTYLWRYPKGEYLENCCAVTVIPGFEKVKVWAAMHHGKLSKLIILPESKGQGWRSLSQGGCIGL